MYNDEDDGYYSTSKRKKDEISSLRKEVEEQKYENRRLRDKIEILENVNETYKNMLEEFWKGIKIHIRSKVDQSTVTKLANKEDLSPEEEFVEDIE